LLFCNRYGGFLFPEVVMKQFHALLTKAGLPEMRFHDVRRFGDCKIALKGQKVRAITF
jgi:hypothetical protein